MNLSQALRKHLRSPLHGLTVIVLIAVVVVMNASAFNAIHALRWKALPYADGDALIDLRVDLVNFGFAVGLTERLRQAVLADSAHFESALGFASARGGGEDGRSWRISRVTPEFSHVLGVDAALGRSFLDSDAQAGADDVLVLSDAIWRSRFGADPTVIGQRVRFSDRPYTVIGVMPAGFAFPDRETEAWRPYVMTAAEREQSEGGNVGDLDVVARLAPGVSQAQGNAALGVIVGNDASLAGLRDNAGLRAQTRSWRERQSAGQGPALALLQIAALILLAVVLANLVNLQLDRLLARSREFSIRRALGAADRALLREVGADLLPPIALGLVLGLALTPLATGVLERRGLLPSTLAQGHDLGIAGVLAGLVVAVLALAGGLAASRIAQRTAPLATRGSATGMGRLRPAMLVAQVMLTTALLGGVGLLLRSAVNLLDVDRGFNAQGVLLTLVDPAGVTVGGREFDPATDSARLAPQVEALRNEVASLPGVESVAVSNAPPFTGWEKVSGVRVPGSGEAIQARSRGVGPGYFTALGIPVREGRGFEDADIGAASPVVVDTLYRDRYLQGREALGATLEVPIDQQGHFRSARIVGVVETVKHEALDESGGLPTVYELDPAPLPVAWLVTRTHGDAQAMAETVRRLLRERHPNIDVGINQPLAELIDASLETRMAVLKALAGFGIGTLLLAGVGLAAVLSLAVRRRTAELGVRMALGATPARVRNTVLGQGGRLIALGLLLGLVVGLALSRVLAAQLFGVSQFDPLSWGGGLALVAVTALLACWWPAHRAAAIDPMVALREE